MTEHPIYPPILVIGTGRSGTSLVAGVLHRLGVFMGHRFVPADRNNKFGAWEDKEYEEILGGLIGGGLPEKEFFIRFELLNKNREALHRPWGVKHPLITKTIGVWLTRFPDAKIIACVREREAVVESVIRAYGWARKDAEKLYDIREPIAGEFGKLFIDFDDAISDPGKTVARIHEYVTADLVASAVGSIVTKELANK